MSERLDTILNRLGITRKEFAKYVGYNDRTIRRWVKKQPPLIVCELLCAWEKLNDCGLSFLPNTVDLDGFNGVLTSEEVKNRIRPLAAIKQMER